MPTAGRAPRLLFLVTEDWYFWAHRLALARAARDAGYVVVVATRVGTLGPRIEAEGFRLEPLAWVRGSRNPLRLVGETLAVIRLYRRLRPDLVHHVSLKPIIVGSIAALVRPGLARVNAWVGRSNEAAALYRGPLLDGFSVREPAFEEWLSLERAHLHELAVTTLRTLARQLVERGASASTSSNGRTNSTRRPVAMAPRATPNSRPRAPAVAGKLVAQAPASSATSA